MNIGHPVWPVHGADTAGTPHCCMMALSDQAGLMPSAMTVEARVQLHPAPLAFEPLAAV